MDGGKKERESEGMEEGRKGRKGGKGGREESKEGEREGRGTGINSTQQRYWSFQEYYGVCTLVGCYRHLASSPGHVGGEKTAWYQLLVHLRPFPDYFHKL